jgi:SpoVK/Ycf46/Vps4 family AAA+-type ATPase
VGAALGLTASQAARAFARSIVAHGRLDERCISAVLEEKRDAVQTTPGLDFVDTGDDDERVGGLEYLKAWLRLRAPTHLERAAAYGLPAPKGIALIGIPGTGKSLAARMVARTWQVPLLRLDMAGIYHSRLGETEQCLTRALAIAEAVSPSVLWVDEVEKLLAHGDQDGGTSLRVLAATLTWMQERTAPVFVVATANDVAALPPELLRRGRFDEVFFLDLPSEAERAAIIRAQLRGRGRDPAAFDVDLLARLSVGLVGAELEQSLTEAMFEAFSDEREFCTQDIADAVLATVPLSRSALERVAAQRAWMREGRARRASGPDPDSTWDADLRLP